MKKIQRILIAIDDEPESNKVALVAFQLMNQLSAEVALVSVVEQSVIMMNDDIMGMGGIGVNENADAEMQIENSWKRSFEEKHKNLIETVFLNHHVSSFILEGVPEDGVLEITNKWKADLIVVGTHGRTGINHFLIGSISEKIIRHSRIPVFVVPTKHLK